MSNVRTYKEILEYAIEREQDAQRDYEAAAATMKDATMRDALLEMAAQERGHEQKLRSIDVDKFIATGAAPVPTLDLAEYVVSGEFRPGMNYQDLLAVAMQKEKAAFRLYSDLAKVTPDESARALLKALAQEEARHKLALEIEYDTHILQEN